jgi:hypothetical protein
LFSYTSHTIRTWDISEIAKGFRASELERGLIRDLLVSDHARNGRKHLNDSRRMVRVGTKKPQMLGGIQIDQCVIFGVLEISRTLFGNRSVFKQNFRSVELYLGQLLVLDGFAAVRVRASDVSAPDLEQKADH